jgi:acyl carrier protein
MGPSNFWNRKSPKERESFIKELNEKESLNIGISNSKNSFERITNGHLIYAINNAFKTDELPVSVNRRDVLSLIKKTLNDKFEVEEDIDSSDKFGDIGLDSLDAVELIMEMEKEFDIVINDVDAESAETVLDLANLIVKEKEASLKSAKKVKAIVTKVAKSTPEPIRVEKSMPISVEKTSAFSSPAEFWNGMTVSERESYISSVSKTTGEKIGISNAKCRFSTISSKALNSALTKGTGEKISEKTDSKIPIVVVNIDEMADETVEEVTMSDELDLCISFDDTGSMYTVRSQVRSNINNLVDRLFDDIPKLRIGIIIHNDYCDMPRHIFVQDFTSDKEKIKKFVNQSSPCGGGDAPECYELALHEASKMSWKSDRRAVVMIGDEVPHHVGYRYGSHTNHLDWKKETEALAAMDVKVYGVQALGRRSSNFFYDGISSTTGGIKLDLSQFQHIPTYINAIAYHQSGQLETYRTSDPAFNTNFALKNMFARLSGGMSTLSAEKIELLSKFQVMKVETDGEMSIRDFVESNGLTFRKGKGYYQLIERTSDGKANSEIIQADKEVLFVDKETGETFADTHWCREKLGVPYGMKATVRPLSMPDVMSKYEIFIQSNSYNRKLDGGCKFLYELEAR